MASIRLKNLVIIAFALDSLLIQVMSLEAKWPRPCDCNPTAITESDISNFHKVDHDLYRGARPTCNGLSHLEALGIRTFINLGGAEAAIHSCEKGAKAAGIHFIHFHISPVQTVLTGVSDERLRSLFAFMQQAPKPIFLSCQLGRDRTGVIVALYRIKRRELSFDEALQEAVYYGYRQYYLGLRVTLDRYKDPLELRSLPAPSLSGMPSRGVCLPKGLSQTARARVLKDGSRARSSSSHRR